MSKFVIFSALFICILFSECKIEWDAVYNNASYALNHSKKALEANNFDHQKFYSDKALKAYKKIEILLKGCDDEELLLNIENTIKELEKAADAPDWDRGRFYTKRVYQKTQDLITSLDLKAAETAVID